VHIAKAKRFMQDWRATVRDHHDRPADFVLGDQLLDRSGGLVEDFDIAPAGYLRTISLASKWRAQGGSQQ
jgi:hypothetical protein